MRKVLFIFGELSDKDVDWMMATGQRERILPGAVLIQEGKPVEALYIVLEGLLRVSVESAGSRELARLGSGEIIGEMSFVDAHPPSATVKALENSTGACDTPVAIGGQAGTRSRALPRAFIGRWRFSCPAGCARWTRRNRRRATMIPTSLIPTFWIWLHLAGSRFDRMLKRLMAS